MPTGAESPINRSEHHAVRAQRSGTLRFPESVAFNLLIEWFDDRVFRLAPSKQIHLLTAFAAKRKRVFAAFRVDGKLAFTNGTCLRADHLDSVSMLDAHAQRDVLNG